MSSADRKRVLATGGAGFLGSHLGTSKNLLRRSITASRARLREAGDSPRLAYLFDMSRCSLNAKLAQARGSLHSNVLVTIFRGTLDAVTQRKQCAVKPLD